jgi:hypothetical protein
LYAYFMKSHRLASDLINVQMWSTLCRNLKAVNLTAVVGLVLISRLRKEVSAIRLKFANLIKLVEIEA